MGFITLSIFYTHLIFTFYSLFLFFFINTDFHLFKWLYIFKSECQIVIISVKKHFSLIIPLTFSLSIVFICFSTFWTLTILYIFIH